VFVPQCLALDQEHGFLGHIRGVVRDPFEVADGAEERQSGLDQLRRALHLLDQIANDRRMIVVDFRVAIANLTSEARILGEKGIQSGMKPS